MQKSKLFATAAMYVIAALLAACGSGEKAPAPAAQAQPIVKPQAAAPIDPTDKMAHAVVIGKSGAAVDLKYDLLNKPEVGKPVELEIALIPGSVLDSMTVSVSGMPGLKVVEGADGSFGKLALGEIARQKITVLIEQPDVVYLTVTATAYAVGLSSNRTFAIPLIVSEHAAPQSEPENAKTAAQPAAQSSQKK